MYASERVINTIKQLEGYHTRLPDGRCQAYQDSVGVWTIGWGTIGPSIRSGLIWTEQQASRALMAEVAMVESSILKTPYATAMTQGIFDALTCFCYNLGTTGLHYPTNFKTFNLLVNTPEAWGNRSLVESTFLLYIQAGSLRQTVERPNPLIEGLITRRRQEVTLWFSE